MFHEHSMTNENVLLKIHQTCLRKGRCQFWGKFN
jgi:hypothetical protein